VGPLPESATPIAPGYQLDRYEILCPIAEGGMASVWVARQRGKHGFEKLVAIKTILPKFASDEMFQRMFLDEARIASGIEHTNVTQVLDLGDENGVLYLVMEWVDGDSLMKLHRAVERHGRTIPCGILLRILADACAGLHAAHELRGRDGQILGVVHRDVSPQNILVSTKGVAKVIDFGIAKARDRVSFETTSGLLKGKVQYMAPEQALGGVVDRRADVWAIGAVLYHLVSGRLPFEAPHHLATLRMLMSAAPPPPLPATVPRPVRDIVSKALSFDPAHRYPAIVHLQRALEQAMVDLRISTSVADVAAFTAEHLADRAGVRRNAVAAALAAAAERARARSGRGQADDSGVSLADSRSSLGGSSGSLRVALPAQGAAQAYPSSHRPLSETSSAMLTRSSLATSMAPGPNRRSRRGIVGIGLALAAGALLMALGMRVAERAGSDSTGVAATQSQSAWKPPSPGPVATGMAPALPIPPASPAESGAVPDAGRAQAPGPISRPVRPADGARTKAVAAPAPPRATSAASAAGAKSGQQDYGF
jgi:serine/threonine-protein kinase